MRSRLISTLALGVITAVFALSPATADPKDVGRWSDPFWEGGADPYDPASKATAKRFPTAVSSIALPDGRVLYWNGLESSEDGELWVINSDGTLAPDNSRTRLLDLTSQTWSTPALERGSTDEPKDEPPFATKDLFCADQELLYDGTLLVAGGSEWRDELFGDDEARVFDPATDEFRSVGQMREPRWYPALVTLPNGRVLVVGGVRRLVSSFAHPDPTAWSQVKLSESYDPATGQWTDAGSDDWSLPLYPRLHLLPDGKVFYSGAGQTWGQMGETPDEATWAFQRVYDPATQKWTLLGPARHGVRGGASSTLLRLEPPYDEAEVLLVGGTLAPSPGSLVATTLSERIRWTAGGIVNESAPKLPIAGITGDTTQLRNRRWFGTSVLLPTGEVLLMNGGDTDDVEDPGSAAAVRMAELYDPVSETWRELSAGKRDRIYHNTAVLLPDGRVLVGGHAPHPAHQVDYDLPLVRANNYRDSTFEIYEPPYLFRGPRPVVSSVAPVGDGSALQLTLGADTTASDISEVVLVRLASITHTVDADMRAVKLNHTVDGSNVIAELPGGGDGRILPPGPYYVFAMRSTPEGSVPSVARVVLVQPTGDGSVAAHTF